MSTVDEFLALAARWESAAAASADQEEGECDELLANVLMDCARELRALLAR